MRAHVHAPIILSLISIHVSLNLYVDDLSYHLLAIVNYLNSGVDFDSLPYAAAASADTKKEDNKSKFLPYTVMSVVELNLLAATKAKSTNSFHQALKYVDAGMYMLKYLRIRIT